MTDTTYGSEVLAAWVDQTGAKVGSMYAAKVGAAHALQDWVTVLMQIIMALLPMCMAFLATPAQLLDRAHKPRLLHRLMLTSAAVKVMQSNHQAKGMKLKEVLAALEELGAQATAEDVAKAIAVSNLI